MQNGGSALMGTGVGRGDDRAIEAAQQAITSPLLDNVSINGSTGVLVNITGGDDLTLGEVTAVSEIVHDAAGDQAEIIFGSVNDAAMAGEVRVTVIATGFDKQSGLHEAMGRAGAGAASVLQFPRRTPAAPGAHENCVAQIPTSFGDMQQTTLRIPDDLRIFVHLGL